MQYQILGDTGVKVSRLCMGTMTFGKESDKATSSAVFHRCREAGINFFDCADVYVGGESERILGELIATCRDEVIITSKVWGRMGSDLNARGSSRRHIMAALEASLQRLKTDYIDLYFLHHFDPDTPLEESLRALEDLITQGKILYAGVSNFAAWQVMKVLGIGAQKGWNRLKCIQQMYSGVKRQAEVEILPMAQTENIGVVTYSPLAGGLLTGKYGTNQQYASGRFAESRMYQQRYSEEWVCEVAQEFVGFAREQGVHPASLAVAWVAHHPAVTAPIIGARSVEQLEPSLKAFDIDMTPDLYARICELSPTPPLAHDRSEEVKTTPAK